VRRAAALAVLVACGAARADGPSPLWDDVAHPDRPRCAALTAEARRHLQAQANEAAIALLRDVVRRCPDRFEGFALLGVTLAEGGQIADARWALERARLLAPDDDRDALVAFHLGFVRSVGGELAGSVAELRRADALGGLNAPMRALLHYDLGDDLMALGRLGEAIDEYRRATRINPSEVMPRLALAVALDRDEQTGESQNELRAVLRVDPFLRKLYSGKYVFVPYADAHYYVALVEQVRGHFAAARAELRAFLAALPDGPYAARAREHLERVAGVDVRELNYGTGVDAAHAAAALAPLVPELEQCLPPVAAPVESTPVIAAPEITWVHVTREGDRYVVGSAFSGCLSQVLNRARLAPPGLGPSLTFPLAMPSP